MSLSELKQALLLRLLSDSGDDRGHSDQEGPRSGQQKKSYHASKCRKDGSNAVAPCGGAHLSGDVAGPGGFVTLLRLLAPLVVGVAATSLARDDSTRTAIRQQLKKTGRLCRAVGRRGRGVCERCTRFICQRFPGWGTRGREVQDRRVAPSRSPNAGGSGRGEAWSQRTANELGRIVWRLEELAGKVELEMAALACAADAQAMDNWGPGRLGGDASVRLAIIAERFGSATRRTELLTRQLQNSASGHMTELPPDVGYLMAILQQSVYSTGMAMRSSWPTVTTPSRQSSPSTRLASSPASTPTGPTCTVHTVGGRDGGDGADPAQHVTARQTAETIMQSCIEWELFADSSCEGVKLLATSLCAEMGRDMHDLNVQSYWLAVTSNLLCMVHEATTPEPRKGDPRRVGEVGEAHSPEGILPKDWFEEFLVNSMTSKFLSIRQGALDRLTAALDACASRKAASASPRPSAQWSHVVRLLDVLAAGLGQAQVPSYLSQQLFAHLFNLLDEHLFNAVLLHNQLCSFENAEQLLVGTKMLRQWISSANSRLTGLRHGALMSYSQQALEFLKALSEKSSGSTLKATDLAASICPSLTSYHCYLLYCGAVKANTQTGGGFFSQSDLTLLRRKVDSSKAEAEGLFIVHKSRELKHDIAALCASVRVIS